MTLILRRASRLRWRGVVGRCIRQRRKPTAGVHDVYRALAAFREGLQATLCGR